MSINDEVTEMLRWVLTRLKRDSLIDDSLTVIFDIREQNDKYPRKQQQKLLARLQADGVITVKHHITFNDNLAMTTGQRAFGDFDTYAVTLLQPHFDTFYKKHVKNAPKPQLQKYEVDYNNGTVKQGGRHHTFSKNMQAVWLLHELWPSRRTIDLNGTITKPGKPKRMDTLQRNSSDPPSPEVLKSTRDTINATMRKKGIDLRVHVGKTLWLEVKSHLS